MGAFGSRNWRLRFIAAGNARTYAPSSITTNWGHQRNLRYIDSRTSKRLEAPMKFLTEGGPFPISMLRACRPPTTPSNASFRAYRTTCAGFLCWLRPLKTSGACLLYVGNASVLRLQLDSASSCSSRLPNTYARPPPTTLTAHSPTVTPRRMPRAPNLAYIFCFRRMASTA